MNYNLKRIKNKNKTIKVDRGSTISEQAGDQSIHSKPVILSLSVSI